MYLISTFNFVHAESLTKTTTKNNNNNNKKKKKENYDEIIDFKQTVKVDTQDLCMCKENMYGCV